MFLSEYDEFLKINNRTCSKPIGSYFTMKIAISKCNQDERCVVVDDQCDDVNSFKLCRFSDLIDSNDPTCSYFKPATGLFCF